MRYTIGSAVLEFRQHLRKRGIRKEDVREGLPVRVVNGEMVPMRGSVFWALGHVAKRAKIDKIFKKIRFDKDYR